MISYGKLEGKWFTQWRVDLLEELVSELQEKLPAANSFCIHYDEETDYHILTFSVAKQLVRVRLYKIFTIDVGETIRRYPKGEILSIPFRIREILERENVLVKA